MTHSGERRGLASVLFVLSVICESSPGITAGTKNRVDSTRPLLFTLRRFLSVRLFRSHSPRRRRESPLIFAALFGRRHGLTEPRSYRGGCQGETLPCFLNTPPPPPHLLRETPCTWHRKWRLHIRYHSRTTQIKCERRTSSRGKYESDLAKNRSVHFHQPAPSSAGASPQLWSGRGRVTPTTLGKWPVHRWAMQAAFPSPQESTNL